MKYNEFLSLDSNFHPVFDLTNEIENMWKRFIPTDNFYNALSSILDSLEGIEKKDRLSVWLQGSYGTGKSHSTSVIKHLLSDDLNQIEDFLQKLDENIQIKKRLENSRQHNKICPILLKGSGNIKDTNSFSLSLQIAVKKALPNLVIKNDFETLISLIEDPNSHIDWESVLDGSKIRIYINNIDGLIKKLKENDLTIYTKVIDYLANKNTHISTKSLTDWLKEVIEKIKEGGSYDKIVIFWDEFTSVLESPYINSILIDIQNLAELSVNNDIFLYLITHRTPSQAYLNNEDIDKVKGRFKIIRYEMENLTTYHIINGAILKKNKENWDIIKNSKIESVKGAINKIISNNDYESVDNIQKKDLENLFPIHPYTAYLLTYISRYIGSSERSIFNFIFDDKIGFRNFIFNNPENGNVFLTADFIWDYFYPEFEKADNEKTSPSVNKWNLIRSNITDQRQIKVFKVILLLNILYRYTLSDETSLVAPSKNNIIYIFEGVFEKNEIEEILKKFEDIKDANDLYLLTTSILNIQEVENEIKRLKDSNAINIKELINKHIDLLKGPLSYQTFREIFLEILPSSFSEVQLESILKRNNKNNIIKVLCFFGINEREIINGKEKLENFARNKIYENIVFLISEQPFGDDNFSKYVENIAKANIADRHNYKEDKNQYLEKANAIASNWIKKCLSSKATWYLRGNHKQIILYTFNEDINNLISKIIFLDSFDIIQNCTSNINLWKRQKSKKFAEIFIFSNNRKDFEDKTEKGIERYIRSIVMNEYNNSEEWIIDNNLRFKDNAYNTPLYKMYVRTEEAIKENKDNSYFNLAEILGFLFQPPFGFYSCMIFFGAIGFILKNYIGQFYDNENGYPIDGKKMIEKIEAIFDYWENDRRNSKTNLLVRLGSIEEKKLIDDLKYIFKINEAESLNDIKWNIRDKIKPDFPLWIYKHDNNISSPVKNAISLLDKFLRLPDENIDIKFINELLDAIEISKIDLLNLLNKDKEYKETIFKNEIKNILSENKQIGTDIEINSTIKYLNENLQEEKGLWEESDVNSKVKDWVINKLSDNTNNEYKFKGENSSNKDSSLISKEKKALLISKIQNYEPYQLKSLIINFIEKNDKFASSVYEILGNIL
ncbi:MAG: hypothetical protein NUV32_01475 [Exilispira sp.]|jgi:hypothetical protein|nr:hypothetical protein [Exilispira sp.]